MAPGGLRRGLVGLWEELRLLLAAQMVELQAVGALPRWIEPVAMASLFIAVANGLVLQVTADPEGPDLAAMAAQFGSLLLAARA